MKKYVILSFSLLVIILFFFIYLKVSTPINTNFYNLTKEFIQKTDCSIKGKEWFSCLGAMGQCGCMAVYKDAENTCRSGKDCSSGYCVVSNGAVPGSDGLYNGKCPKYSNYGCGYAKIEYGKIISKNCVY